LMPLWYTDVHQRVAENDGKFDESFWPEDGIVLSWDRMPGIDGPDDPGKCHANRGGPYGYTDWTEWTGERPPICKYHQVRIDAQVARVRERRRAQTTDVKD
jgi:hypothetical protein